MASPEAYRVSWEIVVSREVGNSNADRTGGLQSRYKSAESTGRMPAVLLGNITYGKNDHQ